MHLRRRSLFMGLGLCWLTSNKKGGKSFVFQQGVFVMSYCIQTYEASSTAKPDHSESFLTAL
jgi:hypothetical protein